MELGKETYGGGTPKTSISNFWEGDLPWIQSSDLVIENTNNVFPQKFITNEAIEKSAAKVIPANSIAIVTRVGVGKLAFMPYKYSTSQDFLSLSKLSEDPLFSVYVLYLLMKKESINSQGTSIKGITKKNLLNTLISIPKSKSEQNNIGTAINHLDNLIASNQQQQKSHDF